MIPLIWSLTWYRRSGVRFSSSGGAAKAHMALKYGRCAWNQGSWSLGDTRTRPSTSHFPVFQRKLGLWATMVVAKGS